MVSISVLNALRAKVAVPFKADLSVFAACDMQAGGLLLTSGAEDGTLSLWLVGQGGKPLDSVDFESGKVLALVGAFQTLTDRNPEIVKH